MEPEHEEEMRFEIMQDTARERHREKVKRWFHDRIFND